MNLPGKSRILNSVGGQCHRRPRGVGDDSWATWHRALRRFISGTVLSVRLETVVQYGRVLTFSSFFSGSFNGAARTRSHRTRVEMARHDSAGRWATSNTDGLSGSGAKFCPERDWEVHYIFSPKRICLIANNPAPTPDPNPNCPESTKVYP
jgi:hypothetical protein